MFGKRPVFVAEDESNPILGIIVLFLTAVIVGLAVSLLAIAFVESVRWLNQALLISSRMRVQFENSPVLVVTATLLAPTIGGVLVGLMFSYLSKERRSLGPADVIRATQMRRPLPDIRSGIVSTAAAVLSLGAGASVGQYGPMVYLGALVGGIADRVSVRIHSFSSIAMACGVAAAISTAFNAPIAGLVFAHEVILRHYSIKAFAPTTVASATGYVVANVMFDRPALFLVEFPGVQFEHEFIMFAALGRGFRRWWRHFFMRMILASAALSRKLRKCTSQFEPVWRGLAVGITALWLPDVLGVGDRYSSFRDN